jgi:hypothetical protein
MGFNKQAIDSTVPLFVRSGSISYINHMGSNLHIGRYLMRKLCAAFLFALLTGAGVAHATTIAASDVADSFTHPLASAKLCFAPVDATGTATGFRVGSLQVVSTPVCGLVSNGVLQSGLSVAPNPTGIYYRITAQNRTTSVTIRDYGMTQITGSSWTLDSYDPTSMAVVPVSTITMGTVTTLAPGTGAYCTISGSSPYLLNCGIPQGATGATGSGTLDSVARSAASAAQATANAALPIAGGSMTGPIIAPNLPINALTYGASPSASATVNATAINNCTNAAVALGGGTCEIPPGTYSVSSNTLLWRGGMRLLGMSNNIQVLTPLGTTLVFSGSGGCDIQTDSSQNNDAFGGEIAYITFVGNNSGDKGICLGPGSAGAPPQMTSIHDNSFHGQTTGLYATSVGYTSVYHNNFNGVNAGIGIDLEPGATYQELSWFDHNSIGSFATCIKIATGAELYFEGNDCAQNTTRGIDMVATTGPVFFDHQNIINSPAAVVFEPSGANSIGGFTMRDSNIYMAGTSTSEVAIGMTGSNTVIEVNLDNINIQKFGSTVPTNSISLSGITPVGLNYTPLSMVNIQDSTGGAHSLPTSAAGTATNFADLSVFNGTPHAPLIWTGTDTYGTGIPQKTLNFEAYDSTGYIAERIRAGLHSAYGSVNGICFDASNSDHAFSSEIWTQAACISYLGEYSNANGIILPARLTGYHGTSGTKVQFSDGTGPSGGMANFASDGSTTALGPATAPTGSCTTNGVWAFSQDGHATVCLSLRWTTKI